VSAETIIESVKQDLARFKAPKTVVFVDVVPRAPNGKADYKTARQYAVDAAAA
jgi:acyl-CoA synthetase (AMP-forming)/AMP-acid ligase II